MVLLPFAPAVPAQAPSGNGAIYGVVLSAKNAQPLSNATVFLTATDDRTALAETITDAQGRFTFSHLGNGKYSLSASHRGYIPAAFDEHETGSTAIVVGPSLVSTGLQFKLQPQASIYGVITEDSGDPVPQARVGLYRLKSDNGEAKPVRAQQTIANEEGYFELANLAPGRYVLSVIGKPWYATRPPSVFSVNRSTEPAANPHSPLDVAYPVTYYPDTTDPASAATIEIGSGERIPINLNLHAVPAIHLRMQVTNSGNEQPPAPQLRQNIFGTQDFVQANITFSTPDPEKSSNLTTVEISGFAPGQYDLAVQGTNNDDPREAQVSLNSDQSLDLASAAALNQISGKVSGAGLPVSSNEIEKASSNDARLTLNQRMRDRLNNQEIDAPAIEAILTPQTGEDRQLARVDQNGSFRFSGIQPGVYEVGFVREGIPLNITQLNATGATLDGHLLKIGSEPITLTSRVTESTTTLHGFAKRNGQSAPGVFIELIPINAAGMPTRSAGIQTNQSDSDGSFDYSHVPQGDYTLIAVEEGWALDYEDPGVLKPYLARGLKITVPPRSGDLLLKEAVQVQAR